MSKDLREYRAYIGFGSHTLEGGRCAGGEAERILTKGRPTPSECSSGEEGRLPEVDARLGSSSSSSLK
jgi:hypothetical protein